MPIDRLIATIARSQYFDIGSPFNLNKALE